MREQVGRVKERERETERIKGKKRKEQSEEMRGKPEKRTME